MSMTKSDILLGHVIDIKENVAGINQHLKDLNGKVITQEKRIGTNEHTISRIDKKIAGWAGGIAAILFVFNIVISELF